MSNNRLILKNTIMLYIRMLFMMIVSFYTTRIVLEYLGAMSYGIYTVVGGMLALFTFIQGSLNLASNRFMSFAIGQNDSDKIKQTFTSALQIHALFGLLIVVFGETIGLWYFFNYLNIPSEYTTQALIVYQVAMLGCVISMLIIPLTSSAIAHEDMSIFAKLSVVDGLLKLAVAYSLSLFKSERIVAYAIMNLSVALFSFGLWLCICHKKYPNCRYINKLNKAQINEMCKFVGWQFFGSLSWMARTQGVNLVLNYFFGPILNASRNIAVQVNGGVTTLLNGFQMASNPQMVKFFASDQLNEMYALVCRTSKLAYYLLLIISIPVYFCTDKILKLWLVNPPEYSTIFVQLMIVATLIENLSGTLPNAFVASGRLKRYQPVTASIMVSEIILVYVAYRMGLPATYMFYAQFVIFTMLFVARLSLLKPILGLNPFTFLKNVTIFEITTTGIAALIIHFCLGVFTKFDLHIVVILIFSFIITAISIFYLGLNSMERKWALSMIRSKLPI